MMPNPLKTSPLNTVDLSECGQFIECWHNGTRSYTVYIGGQLTDAIARAQLWFREWSGLEGNVSRALRSRIEEARAND